MHDAGGYAADGVLVKPDTPTPTAAILLVPDQRGLTRALEDAAARFAAAGYLALVIDLNRSLSPELAEHSDERTRHDLDAALAFLATQPSIRARPRFAPGRTRTGGDAGEIGAVSVGSGAVAVLRLAAESKVRAVALEEPILAIGFPLPTSHPPVLGSVAGRGDAAAGPASVETLARILGGKQASKYLKSYPGAASGFTDSDDAEHFRPDDAADVHRRELDFFAQALAPRLTPPPAH